MYPGVCGLSDSAPYSYLHSTPFFLTDSSRPAHISRYVGGSCCLFSQCGRFPGRCILLLSIVLYDLCSPENEYPTATFFFAMNSSSALRVPHSTGVNTNVHFVSRSRALCAGVSTPATIAGECCKGCMEYAWCCFSTNIDTAAIRSGRRSNGKGVFLPLRMGLACNLLVYLAYLYPWSNLVFLPSQPFVIPNPVRPAPVRPAAAGSMEHGGGMAGDNMWSTYVSEDSIASSCCCES